MYSFTCRVCGMSFPSPRFDAKTCTPTCRQRLRRGQAFAYLAGMTARQQAAERRKHTAADAITSAHKRMVAYAREERAAAGAARAAKRAKRQKDELQIAQNEMLAAQMLAIIADEQRHGDPWHFKKMQSAVAGALKLFLKQRRNDYSAEALAGFFHDIPGYTVEAIEDAIEVLRQEGHYDRIMSGDSDAAADEPEQEEP